MRIRKYIFDGFLIYMIVVLFVMVNRIDELLNLVQLGLLIRIQRKLYIHLIVTRLLMIILRFHFNQVILRFVSKYPPLINVEMVRSDEQRCVMMDHEMEQLARVIIAVLVLLLLLHVVPEYETSVLDGRQRLHQLVIVLKEILCKIFEQ